MVLLPQSLSLLLFYHGHLSRYLPTQKHYLEKKKIFYLLGAIWFVVIVLFYSLVAKVYNLYVTSYNPLSYLGVLKLSQLAPFNKITSFKYIVTIPLGIYTILFLVASIATPELNPIPLVNWPSRITSTILH